jgi:hypothetical protein
LVLFFVGSTVRETEIAMDTKLRIKMGSIEVEYEGSDEFLKKELPELLKGVLELHAKAGGVDESGRDNASDVGSKPDGHKGRVSPSTAAVKLKASSGPELALAAAISLATEGKDSFTRTDLLNAMKQAKSHYKASHRGNLSGSITSLVKGGDLLDQGSNTYALSSQKRKELEAALAA